MITNLNVEDEIKKHYLADDGMWLVEKGKIKEAKLLKEAHARILWLNSQYKHYYNAYNTGYQSSVIRYRDEFTHYKQWLFKEEKLKDDYKLNYMERPWEIEAWKNQELMFEYLTMIYDTTHEGFDYDKNAERV